MQEAHGGVRRTRRCEEERQRWRQKGGWWWWKHAEEVRAAVTECQTSDTTNIISGVGRRGLAPSPHHRSLVCGLTRPSAQACQHKQHPPIVSFGAGMPLQIHQPPLPPSLPSLCCGFPIFASTELTFVSGEGAAACVRV